jgi:outer membrane immunogenic protein
MKQLLLATVSSLALASFASAADLPARMPVKAPAPAMIVQSWAGPYIGVNGGAVWHRLKADTFDPDLFDSATLTGVGATFGGQVGYNWQSQNFLFGLEADANWVGAKDTHQQLGNFGIGAPVNITSKLTWLSTVRARGGLVFGPNLLFVTGGLAIGGVKNFWAIPGFTCGGVPCQVSESDARVGWTAGGGFERFITSNVTAKAEVLYVDLGRETVVGNGYTSRFKNSSIVGRLGVNLKW